MHIVMPNFMTGARANVAITGTVFANIYTLFEVSWKMLSVKSNIFDDLILYFSFILYALLSWLTFSLDDKEEEIVKNKELRNLFAKKSGIHFIITIILVIVLMFI